MEATSARTFTGRMVGMCITITALALLSSSLWPSSLWGQPVQSPSTLNARFPNGSINHGQSRSGAYQSGLLPVPAAQPSVHVANRGSNYPAVSPDRLPLRENRVPASPLKGRFQGQRYVTRNFVVQASTSALAQQIGEDAEQYRAQLAQQWLGRTLPDWQTPCPIQVLITRQAEGETSFLLADDGRGLPSDWNMIVKGPVDRVRDSVLPHEITHTIFATHFRQRLPRWIDEGACTTVEHPVEKQKIHSMLIDFLSPSSRRGLPFNRMFLMREYPPEMLPLYAQGFSVAKYLIAQGGHQNFTRFVERGLTYENQLHGIPAWTRAVQESYQYEDLSELQLAWLDWVQDGSHTEIAQQRYASLQGSGLQGSGRPETGQVTLASLSQAKSPDSGQANAPASSSVVNAANTNFYQQIFSGQYNPSSPPVKMETNQVAPAPSALARANSLRANSEQGNTIPRQAVPSDLPLMNQIPNRGANDAPAGAASDSLVPSDSTLLPIRRGVLR